MITGRLAGVDKRIGTKIEEKQKQQTVAVMVDSVMNGGDEWFAQRENSIKSNF